MDEKDKAFLIVDDEDHAYIRGTLKAGFIKTSKIRKDGMKRYVTTE